MASFEDQLAELEKVVEKLESGDLSLEENVGLFERGMVLSAGCKKELASAESRIQVLLEPKEGGAVKVADFNVDDSDDEEFDEDVDEE